MFVGPHLPGVLVSTYSQAAVCSLNPTRKILFMAESFLRKHPCVLVRKRVKTNIILSVHTQPNKNDHF